VVEAHRRCRAVAVQREHLGRDEFAVEAIRDGVHANRGGDEPGGVDAFATGERDLSERGGTENGDKHPEGRANELRHDVTAPVKGEFSGQIVAWTERQQGCTRYLASHAASC